ncbi:MAG: ribonuclease HII [Propionibacteriaceae bacterium]|nr:ribonuclease HII [Propionibacteriaceae bacterium]
MSLSLYETWLSRVGLTPVAGADEAGRGACAGPLVAAAVVLSGRPEARIEGLRDSKALSAKARERLYEVIMERAEAVSWVELAPAECDRLGLQAANLQALRRAVWRLSSRPGFVLTDGFAVDGLPGAGLGMWKADQVAACVQAAAIVAKVTRDRIMGRLDQVYPDYGFARHKGYCTAAHQRQLERLGPSPVHRLSYGNVERAIRVREP